MPALKFKSSQSESSIPTLPSIEQKGRATYVVNMQPNVSIVSSKELEAPHQSPRPIVIKQSKMAVPTSKFPKGFKSYGKEEPPEKLPSLGANPLEKTRSQPDMFFPNLIVELNVGGVIFATTRDTLLKNEEKRRAFVDVLKKSPVSSYIMTLIVCRKTIKIDYSWTEMESVSSTYSTFYAMEVTQLFLKVLIYKIDYW
jgi:hypothetical protein